jgi:hypothetical protein
MLIRAAVVLSVVARVYDACGLPAGDAEAARATATAILKHAGITLISRSCPCDEVVAPDELVIRVVRAPAGTEGASLGFSYIDRDRRGGTLGTVFADRVTTLAANVPVDARLLLGRAIAHEIGHLLIGVAGHERDGLMREKWTVLDLRKNQPWDWEISRESAVRMRQALVARSRLPLEPATVVAATPPPEEAKAFAESDE